MISNKDNYKLIQVKTIKMLYYFKKYKWIWKKEKTNVYLCEGCPLSTLLAKETGQQDKSWPDREN